MPYKTGNRPKSPYRRETTFPMPVDRSDRIQAAIDMLGLPSRTQFIVSCVERELEFLGLGAK